jgi:hypothetical protein
MVADVVALLPGVSIAHQAKRPLPEIGNGLLDCFE